jgi:hypothetical protein
MDKNANTFVRKSLEFPRRYGLLIVVYLLATGFTNPWLMGDTVDYASSISAFQNGRYLAFWEFGHLLWRPLGWLVFRILSPLTALVVGADHFAQAVLTLLAINWLAGLICVLILRSLVGRFCQREWIANLASVAFLFSAAFLNYGQTGSAYVPGLTLVLLGSLILVSRPIPTAWSCVLAGLALAGGVCLWFPFVLLLPAAITLPLFLFGFEKKRLLTAIHAAVIATLFISLAYILTMNHLGIHDLAGLKEWVTESSHGMDRMRGVPRMVFGFANSLIDLGGEGGLFKRFLKHDTFNPVTVFDLFRTSLWKLAFSYVFLACVLINLSRSKRGRRVIGLLVVNVLPTVVFALFIFEAGDMSRYLMVLPLIFLAFGCSLCSERSIFVVKCIAVAFVGAAILTNTRAMSNPVLNSRQEKVATRVKELVPLLKPGSIVVTSHLQDEINNFTRDFPFNPINRTGNLRYHSVLAINTSQISRWQQDFAVKVLCVWTAGGDAWLSKRLLTARPRADWSWVEGDDPRVSWNDLYRFFSDFDTGQSVGGDDGFVLLTPTMRNRSLIEGLAGEKIVCSN